MDEKKGIKNTVLRPARDKNRLMRINRFLSNRYSIIVILIVMDIIFILTFNYIVNCIGNFPLWFHNMENTSYFELHNVGINMNKILSSGRWKLVYLIGIAILILLDITIVYRIKTSLSDDFFNVNQKGKARWTTLEEIKEQYKEIDMRDTPYSGNGGVIISRYKDKIYIDDSPVNNLIIGITRSGKGEMFVIPSIEVYSRAENKPSLIVNDPKIEIYKSSKKALEERGYEVLLLNLDDPLHSMGFNPLTEVIRKYKEKDYASAELLAQSFSYSVFNPDESSGDSQFFDSTASALLTALIIAHIDDCIKEDELVNKKRMKVYKKKVNAYNSLSDEEKTNKKQVFEEYRKSNKNKDFILDDSVEYIPAEIEFLPSIENEKCINMYSILNTFSELARKKIDANTSALDLYFSERPVMDRAKLKYASIEVAGDRTKGSIYSNMLAKLAIFTFDNIAKMTAESSLNFADIGFGDKPIAVFLGIPDYDRSTHFLASVFIRQLYFVLAKICSDTAKCKIPVKFICDEFGNMPAIEAMETIITVCLGRNISFDLYVQSYSQINKLYGDNSETIIGNCGNQIYILTNDKETASEFSALLGDESITDLQRSGKKLSLDKSFTETIIDKPLLNKNELMELKRNECVVKRVMKREDLNHNRIIPYPIFNSVKSQKEFKFRWEYLADEFQNPNEINLKNINGESREFIEHENRVWDFDKTFKHFMNSELEEDEEVYSCSKNIDSVEQEDPVWKSTLKKYLGEDYEQTYGINNTTTNEEIGKIVQQANLKPFQKRGIMSVIYGERNVSNE